MSSHLLPFGLMAPTGESEFNLVLMLIINTNTDSAISLKTSVDMHVCVNMRVIQLKQNLQRASFRATELRTSRHSKRSIIWIPVDFSRITNRSEADGIKTWACAGKRRTRLHENSYNYMEELIELSFDCVMCNQRRHPIHD